MNSLVRRGAIAAALLAAVLVPALGLVVELIHHPPDLNDGAFHLGAAREAAAALRVGDNPIDFWMPAWLAGFPLFHYYHFGPHLLLASADRLLAEWVPLPVLQRVATLAALAAFPLANYVALRLLRRSRGTAIAAALLSFSIAGHARYGIEFESFTWYGWGLFTQAVALPLLPLALAFGWRAVEGLSRSLAAAGLLAATLLAHVLYGYVAALTIALALLASPTLSAVGPRLWRGTVLAVQFLLLTAFFLVPLYVNRAFHAVSLYDSADKFDSYGAATIIAWFLGGSLLDHGRLPVLTVLCVAGLYLGARQWLQRGDRVHGWIVLSFTFWTLLYFGRPTWGAWIDWLPMSRGLHLERLSSAVHLFALWSAAIAVAAIVRWCRDSSQPLWRRAVVGAGIVAALGSVALERGRYLERNANAVSVAARQFANEGSNFETILEFLRVNPGRVYAGRRGTWGQSYTVAGVPVYHLLAAHAVETIGHAPFSWALSTDFQIQIDALDARLIRLYDIAFLLAPESVVPPPDAELVLASGPHRLYRLRNEGPFGLVRVPLSIAGTFETTWAMTQSWDKGVWSRRGAHAQLVFDARLRSSASVEMLDAFRFTSDDHPEGYSVFEPPGLFMSEPEPPASGRLFDARRGRGDAEVLVETEEPTVVLFRSTYHPAWRASLDGVPTDTMLLTPGLIGVAVPPGKHRLHLVYAPGWKKWALLIAGFALSVLIHLRQCRRSEVSELRTARDMGAPLLVPPAAIASPASPSGRVLVAVALGAVGALLAHLMLMPSRGWERDLYWFATWLRAGVEHGVAHIGQHVWCDYPPLYLYILYGIGWLWDVAAGQPWPADGAMPSQFLLKLPASLATIATALVLGRLALPYLGTAGAALVGVAYALNPALLLNGPVWGQVDALLALFLLLAAVFVARGRFVIGFAWLAVALTFKQQAIVVVPILVLAAVRVGGLAGLFAAARGGLVTALLLLVPFYAAGTAEALFHTLLSVTERYPYVSMNAHNAWWLVFGPASLSTSDLLRFGNGVFSLRTVGLAAFGGAIVLILVRLWHQLGEPRRDRMVSVAEACALAFLAFYLFPTQMHERYVVPALAFVALLCVADRRIWWMYAALSVAMTVSLASTLALNYPQPLGPVSLFLRADRGETFVVAAVMLAAFMLLFARGMAARQFSYSIACAAAAIALVWGASHLPLREPVRLCERGTVAASQGWGVPQRHRSVTGARLSIAGFIFRHGVGAHAPSQLTYDLGGGFRTFEAGFGVDDTANVGQHVQVRVWADDEIRFDSGLVQAGGFPRRVHIPVEGVDRLTLEVLDGGDGRNRDHLNWVEPILRR